MFLRVFVVCCSHVALEFLQSASGFVLCTNLVVLFAFLFGVRRGTAF